MKMSKKDISMLVGLAGILILAAVWYFVVSPMQTDTQALETENIGLKSQVELYQSVNANLAEYQQGIEKMSAEMEDIVTHYPAYISRQDEIMFLSNMEDEYPNDLAIKSISMESAMPITVTTEVVPNAGDDSLAVQLYNQTTNYSFISTYDGAKDMITYLGANSNKKAIDSITLSFDSGTGNLSGSIRLNQYYMTGTEKAYDAIKVPSVRKGVNDVFHTVNGAAGVHADLSAQIEEDAEGEETEEQTQN